jgi:hypothetical protein
MMEWYAGLIMLAVRSDHGCFDAVVHTLFIGDDFTLYIPNAFTSIRLSEESQ